MDRIVFGLTALVLIGVAVTAIVLISRHETRCERFDPRWNTLRTERAPERNRFARLVVKCHRLDGLTKAAVRDRLGPGGRPGARRWSYDAGHYEVQVLSGASLIVFFSASDRVRRARIVNYSISSDN